VHLGFNTYVQHRQKYTHEKYIIIMDGLERRPFQSSRTEWGAPGNLEEMVRLSHSDKMHVVNLKQMDAFL
jgi:hypothetical protein